MPSVKIADFVSASAKYVRAAANAANADKNAYLTKAEGKALPRDLRDNFENHRVGAQANGSVTKSKFVSRYTDYVAVMAKKADKNGDGFLSATEAKNLPRDLKDNFANFKALRPV